MNPHQDRFVKGHSIRIHRTGGGLGAYRVYRRNTDSQGFLEQRLSPFYFHHRNRPGVIQSPHGHADNHLVKLQLRLLVGPGHRLGQTGLDRRQGDRGTLVGGPVHRTQAVGIGGQVLHLGIDEAGQARTQFLAFPAAKSGAPAQPVTYQIAFFISFPA
ncbi:Uncharacterised protein [Mycobacterium tuberculosis]|nr:Uncharacterised protein [Mycobacterium tuberculosis]